MTIRGARAVFRSWAALNSIGSSAEGLGGGGMRVVIVGRSLVEGRWPWIMSAGRSMNEGPGRPYQAWRYALCRASGIVSREDGRRASLVWGVRREMASSSWKAPLEMRWVSAEPPRRRRGNALMLELPSYPSSASCLSPIAILRAEDDSRRHTPGIACSTPGPPTTRHTPGLPVRYP